MLVTVAFALTGIGPGFGQAYRTDGFILDGADGAKRPAVGAGRAFLYSTILPGAGQWYLGAERWVPYAAVEAWGWIRHFDRRREGAALEERYRDLAWAVARRISVGPRQDGDWEYFEALSKFAGSGAYDRDPDRPGIQPETDEATFNGSVWALARAIHFPAAVGDVPEDSPEYAAAIGYYRERAVTGEFAWSWGENVLEQRAYGELIHESDEAFRSATRALGLILANHLVSAIDALISAKLGAADDPSPPVELRSAIGPGGRHPTWVAAVRIRLPRR